MQTSESYIGFTSLPSESEIVDALINDPPEVNWRYVRKLFRIKNKQDRESLINALRPRLYEVDDFRVKSRITLALQALHRSLNIKDYVLVDKKGAVKPEELKTFEKI